MKWFVYSFIGISAATMLITVIFAGPIAEEIASNTEHDFHDFAKSFKDAMEE